MHPTDPHFITPTQIIHNTAEDKALRNNIVPSQHKYVPEEFFSLPIANHVYNERTGVRETIDTLLQG